MWRRHGIISKLPFAQMPVINRVKGEYIISYSQRNEHGHSFGKFRKVFVKGDRIFDREEVLDSRLLPDPNSSFDNAGVMPMQIIENKLFYIGWTNSSEMLYSNFASVANFESGFEIRKIGPILPEKNIGNKFTGTLHVLKLKQSKYIGFYMSANSWLKDENGTFNPSYDLRIAYSANLVKWIDTGRIAIGLEPEESGISSATVLQTDRFFHMWFSVRKSKHFRGGSGSYVINHAYSIDCLNWVRTDHFKLEPVSSMQENMCAYPSVLQCHNTINMLYNGYDFGKGGISLATIPVNKIHIFEEELV